MGQKYLHRNTREIVGQVVDQPGLVNEHLRLLAIPTSCQINRPLWFVPKVRDDIRTLFPTQRDYDELNQRPFFGALDQVGIKDAVLRCAAGECAHFFVPKEALFWQTCEFKPGNL